MHTAFHRSSTTRYFVTLLCDLTLDFVSSMVVTLVLVALYSADVDTSAANLFGLKWFNDEWQMNAINEFQLIFVASWTDLASRLIFSLSMVSNLNTLKRFVSLAIHSTECKREWRHRWTSIVTEAHKRPTPSNAAMSVLVRVNAVAKNNPRFTKAIRIAFAAWGTAVLALHAGAASNHKVSTCVLQVRPWGIAQPSCNLVLINCHREGIVGQRADLHEHLSELHPPSMVKLVIRHCPALEMPPVLQTFASLNAIKIYNTSIATWDKDAALVKAKDPVLFRLTLLRVRLAGGQLPPGLLADDFPPSLAVLTFFDTNIRELPDDLDEKWSKQSLFQLAWAHMTEIPDALLRLAPETLTLTGNPIESARKELFEVPGLIVVDLGDTKIAALPDDVTTPPSTLVFINLDGAGISAFPAWVDGWLETLAGDSYHISAAYSPYCLERSRIFAGELTELTAQSIGSRLMNAAVENWGFLSQTVLCTPAATFRYPIALEDMIAGLAP